jgi:hypothetical protein
MNKKNETTNTQANNAKHFFSKIEKPEIIKSLNSLITNKATLEIWKKGESENLVEKYIPMEFDDENMKLYLEKSGTFFDKMLKSSFIQSDVLFKGKNISDESHLCSGGVLHECPKTKRYVIEINQPVFSGRQRKYYRITAGPHFDIKIKIADQVYDGLDLSAGGTRIKVSKDDLDIIQNQIEFEDVTLRFNKKNFTIQKILINYLGVFDSPGNIQEVRIKFIKIDKPEEEKLIQHINLEVRGEEVFKKFQFGSNED